MLKNAFKKHPLQNRTNVQIKGGGGQRPFEQCSKKLHFFEMGASLTSINNLFHQSPMTCLCWTRHKLAHCAGCRIGLGGGKYDWSEGAGGLLPALCYYPYGQGGAHSWPRRRHLVTQDPSPCSQEGPSPLHSSEVLANYGQFCRICM